jgi:transposase-like protein
MTTKESVIKARVEDGLTYSKITEIYGVAKSTARDWVANFLEEGEEMFQAEQQSQGFVNENFQRDRPQRFKKTEDEVLEFLAQLTPIKVTNNRQPTRSSLTDFAVVGSDFHFGCEDKKCISIFLDVIAELQPSTVILNGDTMDMLAISKYPKDIKHQWSLLDERKAYHQFLDDLIEVSGGAKIYETYSNHSGQSVQGRWRRYLSDRLGELASLPNISDILSYENVFMGDYQDVVEHVDFVQLNDLVVTHGTTVRARGGASCIGEVEKWSSSIMHGHTHRVGSSCKRVPAFGNRPEKQLYGFEGGCLCSLDAAYGNHMNWQAGFNIVSLDEDGVGFGVEQVMINSGIANVSTLGKTFRG